MKTSNKILLGLIAVIFTVPLLLAAALQSKIKKGIYTVEKYDNAGPAKFASGTFTSAKVIKIVAPNPDLLTCHLKPADTMSYNYYKGDGNDSVKVFTGNDTLYITYVASVRKPNKNRNQNNEHLEIEVNLPAFNNVIADGAEVILDSLGASAGTLSIILKNNGSIRDGSESKEKNISKELPAAVIKKIRVVPEPKIVKAKITRDYGVQNIEIVKDKSLVNADIREYLIYRLL